MSNVSETYSGQMTRYDGNKTDWVTSVETPDPNPLPSITGWNVLVRPVPISEEHEFKSGGKIILPSTLTEDVKFLTNVGQVKAMGPACFRDPNLKPDDKGYPHGRYLGPWCKVGDYVVWGKHQGVKLVIKGVAFVLLQDELILMTLENPTDINPLFNAFKV